MNSIQYNEIKKQLEEIDIYTIKENSKDTVLILLGFLAERKLVENIDELYQIVLSRLPKNDLLLNQENLSGTHPLYFICKHASKPVILSYIKHGSNPTNAGHDVHLEHHNVFMTKNIKKPPKRHAFAALLENNKLKKEDIIELMDIFFDNKNVNPYCLTEYQDSLLHLTVFDIDIFKHAVTYQKNFDALNIFYEKPIHVYCSQENINIQDFLFILNHTKNPFSTTKNKDNFLHYIAYNKAKGLFSYCIKTYPQLNIENKYKVTPKEFFLDFAKAYDKFEYNRRKAHNFVKKSEHISLNLPKKQKDNTMTASINF